MPPLPESMLEVPPANTNVWTTGSRVTAERCSPAETDPVIARRVFALREQLRRINRRSSGPFSHPLARSGPLRGLREHICDVSRLADAALLSAETAERTHSETLVKDVRLLLQTLQSWTERLENQIWRLESQSMWSNRLSLIISEQPIRRETVFSFCEAISVETQRLPNAAILLPEPGLPVAANSVNISDGNSDGVTCSLGWSVEQIRVSVFAANSLLVHCKSADIAALALKLFADRSSGLASRLGAPLTRLNQSLQLPLHEPNSTTARTETMAIQADCFTPLEICSATTGMLKQIHSASMSAGNLLIPPSPPAFYSRIGSSGVMTGDAAMISIGQLLGIIPAAADHPGTIRLDAPESTESAGSNAHQFPESTILTHKLRWHPGATVGNNPAVPKPRLTSRLRLDSAALRVISSDH